MIWKFGDAMLPCNEKKDFESKNIAMDIVCRVYLSEAPNKDLEKDAKELDGEFCHLRRQAIANHKVDAMQSRWC